MSDRMRKAREHTGLSQPEFAKELGVSPGTVSNAERGSVKVRKITLMAWSMRTGVSMKWLETGANDALNPSPTPGQESDAEGLDTSPKA